MAASLAQAGYHIFTTVESSHRIALAGAQRRQRQTHVAEPDNRYLVAE